MLVREYDDADHDGVVALVQAVSALGGAVGWLAVPSAAEGAAWLRDLTSTATVLVAVEDGRVVGSGAWARQTAPVTRNLATTSKVMTHPDARGRGAARAICEALVADCRDAAIELLVLDVRGNNHGAIRLYASLGFVTTGRRPDAIAVGDERFDQVLMHLDLRVGRACLVRNGGRGGGLGGSA